MSSNPSIKLLIAEDEKNLGLVLQKEMSRLGHQVTLVHDAEAAIKTAREAEFDVALLDIMMPGRSGLEVLRELRQQDQPPEVLMMTGHATVETALQRRMTWSCIVSHYAGPPRCSAGSATGCQLRP